MWIEHLSVGPEHLRIPIDEMEVDGYSIAGCNPSAAAETDVRLSLSNDGRARGMESDRFVASHAKELCVSPIRVVRVVDRPPLELFHGSSNHVSGSPNSSGQVDDRF